MKQGDHVKVKRFGYQHHGIYIGNGHVIHYTGDVWKHITGQEKACIRRDTLEDFADNRKIEVVHYTSCDPTEKVLERARERLREQDYALFSNNCEHFATWCKTGKKKSQQVRDAGVDFVQGAVVGSTKELLKAGAKATGSEALKSLSKEASKTVLKEGAKVFGKEGAKTLARGNVVTALAVGLLEQTKDTVMYASGEIDGKEYGRRSAGNAVSTGGSIGGMAAGAAIGTAILPVVGTAIGGFIGGIIGSVGGGILGRNLF
jgi:hypothetical protein